MKFNDGAFNEHRSHKTLVDEINEYILLNKECVE